MSFKNKYVASTEMMKSNNVFAQTCNKLSLLLKENRSLTHQHVFSSSMSGNSMKNLFSKNKEKEDDIKSLDLFPLMSSSAVVDTDDESTHNHTAHHKEVTITKEDGNSKRASMTIFYGGSVLVLDDLSEDKAGEIMSLASQGVIQTQTIMDNNNNKATCTIDQPITSHSSSVLPHQPHSSSSHFLPIARRVSLHRFMDKRRNRIAASAPYPSQSTSRENIDKMMMGQRLEKELELKLF